jgi:anti-anti-sigma factor
MSDFESSYFQLDRDGEFAVATFSTRRLTDEDNVEQLGHELNAIVEKLQHRQVVLNVETIEYVTSSVIGKWIMLHRKLDREGGKLVVCGVSPSLADILGTAKLMNYFTVTENPQSARDALTSKPPSSRTGA